MKENGAGTRECPDLREALDEFIVVSSSSELTGGITSRFMMGLI
jgi:hypothetical protein